MRNGGTCVLKDDMAEILGMFRKADVLVLATPVYFYVQILLERYAYSEISGTSILI